MDEKQDTNKKTGFFSDKPAILIAGISALSALITSAIMLIANYHLQSDNRLKNSLHKEIVSAERISADLTNEFASMTLVIANTRSVPEKEKFEILKTLSELYIAIDRLERRVDNNSSELENYRHAISMLRSNLINTDNFSQYKQTIEAMGSVKEAEREAFTWLSLKADIKPTNS